MYLTSSLQVWKLSDHVHYTEDVEYNIKAVISMATYGYLESHD
jgi:hypothetical protein